MSYVDVLRAIDDWRLKKMIEEHRKYMKETGYDVWALICVGRVELLTI